MRGPTAWEDIEALVSGRVAETDSLDFKRELGPKNDNVDTAKDIAAMTVEGGVIVIGIEEDTVDRAADIRPFSLDGIGNRIRQIADTLIFPPPAFEIRAITKQPDDSDGVVVVDVPPSQVAPHCVAERFPRRSDATTKTLTEGEISRLYSTRRFAVSEITEPASASGQVSRFLGHMGEENEYGSMVLRDGIASMDISVSVQNRGRHPQEPWLIESLVDAVAQTADWAAERYPPRIFPAVVNSRRSGAVRRSDGVSFSRNLGEQLTQEFDSGIAVSFSGQLMLKALVPTRWSLEEGSELAYGCAYENHLFAELTAFLYLAGVWFQEYPLAGYVDSSIELGGFRDCESFAATHGNVGIGPGTGPSAEMTYSAVRRFPIAYLIHGPDQAAAELTAPWLSTFVDERDLHGMLTSSRDSVLKRDSPEN